MAGFPLRSNLGGGALLRSTKGRDRNMLFNAKPIIGDGPAKFRVRRCPGRAVEGPYYLVCDDNDRAAAAVVATLIRSRSYPRKAERVVFVCMVTPGHRGSYDVRCVPLDMGNHHDAQLREAMTIARESRLFGRIAEAEYVPGAIDMAVDGQCLSLGAWGRDRG